MNEQTQGKVKNLDIITDDIRLAELIVYDSIRMSISKENFASLQALRLIEGKNRIYHFQNAYRILKIQNVAFLCEHYQFLFHYVFCERQNNELALYSIDEVASRIIRTWLELYELHHLFDDEMRMVAESVYKYDILGDNDDINDIINHIIELSGQCDLRMLQGFFYDLKERNEI